MTTTTPWFPVKTKPHHIGAYEIQSINGNTWFSWWNGKNWNSNWPTAQRACDNRFFGDTRNVKGWRGLSEEPKNV